MFFSRYFPSVMSDCLDQNLLTFILTAVCTPTFFKNPYLVSKLIEILFVINPAVQVSYGTKWAWLPNKFSYALRGRSKTTWTKFLDFLTPHPLGGQFYLVGLID